MPDSKCVSSEEDFSRLYVDAGRIGLEAGDAGEGVGNHHRHKRRDIAFATGGNPFGIEAGEGQAAGVAHGGQKVEAAKGEGVQVMAFCQDLQRLIDLHRAGIGIPDLAVHHLLRRSGLALGLGNLRKELFHRHFLHPDAQLVQQGHRVHVTGDKPVRGLADDADAHVLQAGAGFLHRGQRLDPTGDIGIVPMQDLAPKPLLAQVRQNLQRRSQGIALAGRQQIVPVDAAGEHFGQQRLENALRTAGTDIDEVQCMRSEIREIGPLELIIPLREDSLQESVGKLGNGGLVMQAGSDGIDGDHNKKGSWSCKTFPMQR